MKLTREQNCAVMVEIYDFFAPIADGQRETLNLTQAIAKDVINDIEETACWTDYEDDEINISDTHIAIVRVLKNRLGVE